MNNQLTFNIIPSGAIYLSVRLSRSNNTTADGNGISLKSAKIPSIMIANTEFKHFPLFVYDDVKNETMDLLGTDILKYFNYSINNAKGIIHFELRKDYIKIMELEQEQSILKKSFFINKLTNDN